MCIHIIKLKKGIKAINSKWSSKQLDRTPSRRVAQGQERERLGLQLVLRWCLQSRGLLLEPLRCSSSTRCRTRHQCTMQHHSRAVMTIHFSLSWTQTTMALISRGTAPSSSRAKKWTPSSWSLINILFSTRGFRRRFRRLPVPTHSVDSTLPK